MSLNFHWIQKYQPSKLNNRKNVRFSSKKRMASILIRLKREKASVKFKPEDYVHSRNFHPINSRRIVPFKENPLDL